VECKILDRTHLILDIFAQRAETSYARTQVELAQCQYLLPRFPECGLTWNVKRGIECGPGETEIETDRRIVRDRISLLKDKIKAIETTNGQRNVVIAGLWFVWFVGYTNVGKSTYECHRGKVMFCRKQTFATLDTTVRKVVIKKLAFLIR
jgi:GTP-binding protein HflX